MLRDSERKGEARASLKLAAVQSVHRMSSRPRLNSKSNIRNAVAGPEQACFLIIRARLKRLTNPRSQKRSIQSKRQSPQINPYSREDIKSSPMQTSRFLSQSAFKAPVQKTAHYVSTSRPFLKSRASTPSIQQQQQYLLSAQRRNMASAASFYDFKPLDSKHTSSTEHHPRSGG